MLNWILTGAWNLVYDLSLLGSLPNSLLEYLPPGCIPTLRPRPLFNVGIHDIPYLASLDPSRSRQDSGVEPSWIACTTDSVLNTKQELYDALITLPPLYSRHAPERVYPKIALMHSPDTKTKSSHTLLLKATQRDARRYYMLRRGLRRFSPDRPTSTEDEVDSDADSTFSTSPIVEPLSWARLAYTSFIWWASAGENRDGLSEEEEEQQIEQDTRLLESVETLARPPSASAAGRRSIHPEDPGQHPPEVALVAYFRRLTSQTFITLARAITRKDSESRGETDADSLNDTPYLDDPADDDTDLSMSMSRQSIHGDESNTPLLRKRPGPQQSTQHAIQSARAPSGADTITITIADMAEMGLDVWSATDRVFVEELVWLWWGREAHVDAARIRCCGISIL